MTCSLRRSDPDAITEGLNRVYEAVDTQPDAAVLAAGRALLERVEW